MCHKLNSFLYYYTENIAAVAAPKSTSSAKEGVKPKSKASDSTREGAGVKSKKGLPKDDRKVTLINKEKSSKGSKNLYS